MCNFRVGQKVVCIKETTHVINNLGLPHFKKGQILTISSMKTSDFEGALSEPALVLQFSERSHLQWAHYSGFRPVVSRKTDISIFKAMLNPSKQEIRA